MIYAILGIGLGLVLCYTFITDFMKMKSDTDKHLANGNYTKHNHASGQILFNIVGILIGVFAVYLSIQPESKDNITMALGLGLSFMFAGQCLPLLYTSSYYENESSAITCGKLIRFKSVKSIDAKKAMFMQNFVITTYNGDEIIVSKKTAEFLQEKSGKKINYKKRR